MTQSKRERLWEKICKEHGYEIEFKKYEYWQAPYAIKKTHEFPLAITGCQNNSLYIATIKDIVANEENFLKLMNANKRYPLLPCWKNNSIVALQGVDELA